MWTSKDWAGYRPRQFDPGTYILSGHSAQPFNDVNNQWHTQECQWFWILWFWDSEMCGLTCVINKLTNTGSIHTTQVPSCTEDSNFRRPLTRIIVSILISLFLYLMTFSDTEVINAYFTNLSKARNIFRK